MSRADEYLSELRNERPPPAELLQATVKLLAVTRKINIEELYLHAHINPKGISVVQFHWGPNVLNKQYCQDKELVVVLDQKAGDSVVSIYSWFTGDGLEDEEKKLSSVYDVIELLLHYERI
jgi:hypothetical protein